MSLASDTEVVFPADDYHSVKKFHSLSIRISYGYQWGPHLAEPNTFD